MFRLDIYKSFKPIIGATGIGILSCKSPINTYCEIPIHKKGFIMAAYNDNKKRKRVPVCVHSYMKIIREDGVVVNIKGDKVDV